MEIEGKVLKTTTADGFELDVVIAQKYSMASAISEDSGTEKIAKFFPQ